MWVVGNEAQELKKGVTKFPVGPWITVCLYLLYENIFYPAPPKMINIQIIRPC